MMRPLLASVFVLVPGLAGAQWKDLPCVLCHPSRDREVYEVFANTPGVLVGNESAQEFVCLSCHNGSVVDHREQLGRGGQHPSGFQVPRPLPDPFPLYLGERMECGTCHSPHAEGPGSERWLRVPDDGVSPCTGCHEPKHDRHLGWKLSPRQLQDVRALGGRAGSKREIVCSSCHVAHGARGPKLLLAPFGPERNALCKTCHPELSVKGLSVKERPQPCVDCHVTHGDSPGLLAGGAKGPCFRCHFERVGDREHVSSTPTCAECHSVHHPVMVGGDRAGLLRMPKQQGLLCAPCHPSLGVRHGVNTAVVAEDFSLLLARGLAPGPSGEINCNTCHRVHAAADSPLLVLSRSLLCLYCHRTENPYGGAGIKPGVHPVGVFLRESQTLSTRAPPARATTPNVLNCVSCHSAHGSSGAPEPDCIDCHPTQAPGSGHGGVEGCGACHAIHGATPPSRTCDRCHAEEAQNRPHGPGVASVVPSFPGFNDDGVRSPWGKIACPTCHDPHSTSGALLRAGSSTDTCTVCHPDKRSMLGGAHDGSALAASAGATNSCEPCHPAHGEARPVGDDPLGQLCRECHGEVIRSLSGHTPTGSPAWERLTESLPLFDRSGARNSYGFVTCATCHDVHRAGDARSMRLESRDPPRLCLACHAEKESLLGSAHDPRGQGEGEACGICHPMHSRGEAPPFWRLRAEARGTWNDRMCSPCHGPPADAPLPHSGRGSHPVNLHLPARMSAEGLRLYDSLGGRAGRIVGCSTCHDLHGVSPDGKSRWPKFLRKDPSKGDLCITCHTNSGAILGTPHDLRERAPTGLGPCGPCHAVHRGQTERYLWGLKPASGKYMHNTLCRSCHAQGGPVQSEFLLLQYHMKDAEPIRSPRGPIYLQRPMDLLDELALRTSDEPVIPLFDRAGVAGPQGSLQCVSCHDPHVWSPLGTFVKPGFGNLGPNVPTKFLRLADARAAARSVCAVCHSTDAVKRYELYHHVWEDLGQEVQ